MNEQDERRYRRSGQAIYVDGVVREIIDEDV